MTKSRYLMIGGFLGAGKTTTMLRLAELLTARGLRVGLITNDQASGLVDTSLARHRDVAVEEIAMNPGRVVVAKRNNRMNLLE